MAQWDYVSFAYAILVTAGGVIGYLKASSIPSLISGIAFGTIAGIGAYLTSVNPSNVVVTLCASGLLTAVMGMRFYNTHKVFPAGVVFLISFLMLARCIYRMSSH